MIISISGHLGRQVALAVIDCHITTHHGIELRQTSAAVERYRGEGRVPRSPMLPALEAIEAFLGAPLKELDLPDEASFSGMLLEV
jgi:hypothetical protein